MSQQTATSVHDGNLGQLLDDLKEKFGKQTRTEVFRLALALLWIAGQAKEDGFKLTLSSLDGQTTKEIVLP